MPLNTQLQSVISWLANAFAAVTSERKVTSKGQDRSYPQAITVAYNRFAVTYPELVAYLFDAHFVKHTAASLLRPFQRPSVPLPTALDLALAWDRQLSNWF